MRLSHPIERLADIDSGVLRRTEPDAYPAKDQINQRRLIPNATKAISQNKKGD